MNVTLLLESQNEIKDKAIAHCIDNKTYCSCLSFITQTEINMINRHFFH